MTRARILADYVSSGDELALKAPLASPAFTGTPTGITAAHLEAGVLPSDVTGGSGLTAVNAANIAAGVLPVGVTGGSGLDAVSVSQSTGQIVSYKIIEWVDEVTAAITCNSTTWAEINSALRITHAMSDSGNKLVFFFNSLDLHLASGNGYIAVAKTTDTTSRITADNLLYVKGANITEIFDQVGFSEYSPGVITEFIYTPIHSSTALFYIQNTNTQGKLRFSLMEIKG